MRKKFQLLLLLLMPICGIAQSVVIGSLEDETLRNKQLLGEYDSSVSFTVRPLVAAMKIDWKHPAFKMLPVELIQQYNTHHPYGWNDGAMIAAKGYQAMVRAGVYAAYGPLEVQLMPEMVYAANPSYESNAAYGSNAGGGYQKIFAGQSSIKLSAGPISVGVATGNLWWGPGQRSSLLMSNNAPGISHLFLATRKPLHTPIGSFEFQLIGAKLTSNSERNYENQNLTNNLLNNNDRYLNAYAITYQPKWVPGLFIGITRGIQTYQESVDNSSGSFMSKYLPVLGKAVDKNNAQGDDTLTTDQLASVFLRWVLPQAHAEFYVEFGKNDYSQELRAYLGAPTHAAAHIVGFKKIVPLKNDAYLNFGFEMIRLTQSPDYLLRNAGNWYVHGQIGQGYSQENQIIGAGAGLGANVQSLQTTWIKGLKQLGVLFERVERDPQYHAAKWTDISIGFMPQIKYRNIVFSGIFQFINSANYAWEQGAGRFNLHTKIGMRYLIENK
ncbi:MAG: capsule assembly Wzi family protein [Sediminibacterium sp.]|nr:capsule assembly Wzi family protein [Sediminibacterium sp.]